MAAFFRRGRAETFFAARSFFRPIRAFCCFLEPGRLDFTLLRLAGLRLHLAAFVDAVDFDLMFGVSAADSANTIDPAGPSAEVGKVPAASAAG
jgi:hypothetical protein